MNLANGKNDLIKLSFWNMWLNELPGSFPKGEVIESLSERWGLTIANVYGRLKNEKFMCLTSDLNFLFNRYGIAFDFKERGFFLDREKYDLIQQNHELEAAQLLGLSK